MIKKIAVFACLFLALGAKAQDRMDYTLEFLQPGLKYRTLDIAAVVGQASLFESVTRSGEAHETSDGVVVYPLPQSIMSDGRVLTQIRYKVRNKRTLVTYAALVNVKRGEMVPVSPGVDGPAARLTLAN
jgi:hypothetical protein